MNTIRTHDSTLKAVEKYSKKTVDILTSDHQRRLEQPCQPSFFWSPSPTFISSSYQPASSPTTTVFPLQHLSTSVQPCPASQPPHHWSSQAYFSAYLSFLFTVVGTTGFLGVLAGRLPGDWGFFVPYLIGSISLVVLAVGSISPG
ncbi:hypothetical protein CsSME_00024516 [Camellia sinensis var. sinensis]